jgi:hypothetical protein
MPRGQSNLPRPIALQIDKSSVLKALQVIDSDVTSRQKVLDMETEFRTRIGAHVNSLPLASARLERFNTSPFVLMFYCKQRGYRGCINKTPHVGELANLRSIKRIEAR